MCVHLATWINLYLCIVWYEGVVPLQTLGRAKVSVGIDPTPVFNMNYIFLVHRVFTQILLNSCCNISLYTI